ncbi:hypothetical protein BDV19DRAFT_394834 [Aspergillus venezuelensis]
MTEPAERSRTPAAEEVPDTTKSTNPPEIDRTLEETVPEGPWGNKGVTSRRVGKKKPIEKDSSLNVRINLDLRADVALELHAVLQGDVTIGLF